MEKLKVGRRGQITIPSQIREQAGIEAGTQLSIELEGDHIIIRPIKHTLLNLRGIVEVDEEQDFNAVRESAVRRRADRAAGSGK